MVKEITLKELIASNILPLHGEMRAIGLNWFKDLHNGLCYHVVRIDNGGLQIAETRQSTITHKKKYDYSYRRKPTTITVIKCTDCGEERTIRVQDKHQTKKCRSCQRKTRLKVRLDAYYKEKKKKTKTTDNKMARIILRKKNRLTSMPRSVL